MNEGEKRIGGYSEHDFLCQTKGLDSSFHTFIRTDREKYLLIYATVLRMSRRPEVLKAQENENGIQEIVGILEQLASGSLAVEAAHRRCSELIQDFARRIKDRSILNAAERVYWDFLCPLQVFILKPSYDAIARFHIEEIKQEVDEKLDLYKRDFFDIVGNPFHPPALQSEWLAWDGGTIPRLAQAMYDQQDFDSMPVLADAFKEAGCTDPVILVHCREQREHIRGCWLIDQVLQKR